MDRAFHILNQYELAGNRVAQEVGPENADRLSESLFRRIGAHTKMLDFSPASLRRLETILLGYAQRQEQASTPIHSWSEQDTLAFIREIAAYVGLTLVRNLGGRWLQDNKMFGPSYRVDEPFKITKGSYSYHSSGVSYQLGSIGASCIDQIVEAKKPKLYSIYSEVKRKSAKE